MHLPYHYLDVNLKPICLLLHLSSHLVTQHVSSLLRDFIFVVLDVGVIIL